MIHWVKQGAIGKATKVLGENGVIVYPTDTLYGFGGNANSADAIQKINIIKGRTSPMSVLAPDKETALTWMEIPEEKHELIINCLREKTTVIVPIKNGIVHPLILGDGNSLGIRIPHHPFCKALSQSMSNPIITTSVNRTGKPPMRSPKKIEMEFANDVDLIIEDGDLSASASRIYIYKKGKLNILRP